MSHGMNEYLYLFYFIGYYENIMCWFASSCEDISISLFGIFAILFIILYSIVNLIF